MRSNLKVVFAEKVLVSLMNCAQDPLKTLNNENFQFLALSKKFSVLSKHALSIKITKNYIFCLIFSKKQKV